MQNEFITTTDQLSRRWSTPEIQLIIHTILGKIGIVISDPISIVNDHSLKEHYDSALKLYKKLNEIKLEAKLIYKFPNLCPYEEGDILVYNYKGEDIIYGAGLFNFYAISESLKSKLQC